jgi:Abnormal spindle-like microcephaly-assoc'd, ASPM-SPD-2-Hydin/Protein of unknown function (DUF1573)
MNIQRFTQFAAIAAEKSQARPAISKHHNPFIFMLLAPILALCLLQAGCTGLTSANAPADPTNATTITVAGATGSFGSVATGSSVTQTFMVTNTGTATLTITQLAASGAGFSVSGVTLPITVNAGKSGSFSVKFTPTTAGAAAGSVSMTANTSPAVTTIALSGTGTTGGQPAISVSPTLVSFGGVGVGQNVGAPVSITNTGAGTLTISNVSASGSGFAVAGVSLPITLGAGQSATIIATLNPTTAGNISGSMTFANNSSTSSLVVPMSGTGMVSQGQPALSVNPSSMGFGGVGVGVNVGQPMTVTNVGTGTLTISNVMAAGAGFSVTGVALPITLTANQSANIVVNLTPASAGNLSGSITFANNTAVPSVVIPLSGTGVAAGQPGISVNPASFDFGNVAVAASGTHTFTISNSGSAALSISNIAASGTGFSVSGFTLPVSVAAGQSTTITGKFVPTAGGAFGGSITLTNNSPTPNVVVALSGTGVAAGQPSISMNPTSVNFGNVTVGSPNSQTVLIQNSGTAALTVSQATASGTGFSISGLAIPATIAAGGSTTFNVSFAPAGAGAASGSVSIVSNAPGSPTALPLSGTGVSTTMSLSASTTNLIFGSVSIGSNSSQPVTLTNNGNSTVTIGSVSATGAGFSTSGVSAGQTIGAGQTASLSVKFTPASTAAVSGTVTVTSNATNSPISISVSGTGTQAVAHSVSLSWTASTSSVIGYNVYRSTISGGPYTLITGSPNGGITYTDTAVQAGVTYFYVVTAVDANGNESAFSNEASATIPTP